jgi:serine/threonine protein kinase
MLTAGTILQGRYRIAAPLGGGGFGSVYRAWHLNLGAPVAVKEMTPQPGLDAARLSRLRLQFQQEASVLAHLDHPNLVDVTDYFEEGGNAYLVMNLVQGETLAELIERQGPLPEEQVLAWADQLLDALAYCHSSGVIHRDVKPQNVIIRPDGRAVLVDFGLVKLWDPNDPHTRTAIRGMGTPEYAPPEQYGMQPGHTDPRSDIYGLGATLYHALTGEPPLTASDRTAGLLEFPGVRELNRRVSARTGALVERAMALRVPERFPDAADMQAALQRAGSSPVALNRVSSSQWRAVGRSGLLRAALNSMSSFQRAVLVLGGGLVAIAFCVMTCVGIAVADGVLGPTDTPTSTATVAPTETTMPRNTATPKPTSTPTPTRLPPTPVPTETQPPPPTATVAPTETTMPRNTATPKPTSTPTPTSLPPTPVPTETQPPPPTDDSGGGGGGGDKPPARP